MDNSQAEPLVEACWDSGQSLPGKSVDFAIDPWYLEAAAIRKPWLVSCAQS